MATGSGKTVVMAMLIAWQVINKGQSWGVRPNFLNNFCVALRGTLRSRWGPADKKRGPSDPARAGQSLATNNNQRRERKDRRLKSRAAAGKSPR